MCGCTTETDILAIKEIKCIMKIDEEYHKKEVEYQAWHKAHNPRDPKIWHIAFSEHVGHDIRISHNLNHCYLWCVSCKNQQNTGYDFLIFKTYENSNTAVGNRKPIKIGIT